MEGRDGLKVSAAASGTATTRSGDSANRSIAARRTVSVGVITMVAKPIRSSRGVLLRTRDAVGLPLWIEPRAQIVQRHHAGPQRNIRNRVIRSVKQFDPAAPHFAIQSPRPPFALGRISRPVTQ